ncbi:MAG: hypothetical protein ACF8XB_20425 [Planctomycetota bacterium JB042]
MTLRLLRASLLPIVLGLSACSGREEVAETPFSGSGALRTPGVMGAAFLGVEVVRAAARSNELALPDDVDLLVLLLDREAFGAGVALDLGGSGASAAVEALVDAGALERVEGRDAAYRMNDPFRSGEIARLPGPVGPGLPLAFAGELRRFDVDGRVLLLPTIDLRSELRTLGAAVRREVSPSSVAIALDGEELARFARESVLPMFQGASAILGASAREHGAAIEAMVLVATAAVDAFAQVEGIVIEGELEGGRLDRIGPTRQRITPVPGSAVAALCGALRALDGDWPRIADGESGLLLAVDGTAFVDAVGATLEEPLIDRTLEFVERVESGLAAARGLGITGIAVTGRGGAVRVSGTPADGDVRVLEGLLDTPLARDGEWLRPSDGGGNAERAAAPVAGPSLWARVVGPDRGLELTFTLEWDGVRLEGTIAPK